MKRWVESGRGVLSVLMIVLNTLVLFPVLMGFALLKLLIPIRPFRRLCTSVLNQIARLWIGINNLMTDLLHSIEWDIRGAENLSNQHWYLVICNHQSWADIPAIQYALNGKIPLLKFFLKQQLIWVPLLGIAWWALDFPFMRRYTREQIEARPELKGKDLETTRVACQKFHEIPVTVGNFMEGTRFTPQKHAKQQSPYEFLLKPRAGGTAFVLGAMGSTLHTMLDVTIVYKEKRHEIWDYLCGRISRIVIDIRTLEIPGRFLGMNYEGDAQARADFQQWLSGLWNDKDRRIAALRAELD